MFFAQIGVSIPVFWLGVLLMFWFAVEMNWLPAVGRGEPLLSAMGAALAGHPAALLDSLRHLVLPALTLGLHSAAVMSRLVRSSDARDLATGFCSHRLCQGTSRLEGGLAPRHANALLPVLSVIGLRFGALLGGAVLTETIFGWPGLGQLAVTAISQRDIPLVQGIILVFALMFALVNLGVDLLTGALDPRIRMESEA